MEPIETRSDIRSRQFPVQPAQIFAAIRDPAALARWWEPAGFLNTIHQFDFTPGGRWLMTMHGPDGTDHPNESRFERIVEDTLVAIEHLGGHHFHLLIELQPRDGGTELTWTQTFDTVEHYRRVEDFVVTANEQNLDRLTAEVGGAAVT